MTAVAIIAGVIGVLCALVQCFYLGVMYGAKRLTDKTIGKYRALPVGKQRDAASGYMLFLDAATEVFSGRGAPPP